MDMQLRGSGQGPSCSDLSIASSYWQYGLLCAASKCCYTRSMYWSVRTTLRPLRTSTTKAVYAPVACRNSPAMESEASEVASRHSGPRRAQSCSRRALTSARPSGRMATPPRGTPADLETLRGCSDRPVCLPGHVPLPAVFLPVRGDPQYRRTGIQLASGPMQICVPPVSLLAQTLCKVREDEDQVLLVAPYWPNRTWFPELMLLATAPPWQNPLRRDLLSQRGGTLWHPHPNLWNFHIWSLVLGGLPPAVVKNITSARALSTRHAYRLKWNLFVDWCSPCREDPHRCPIAVVLSLLQDGLERRLSPSTLKVYDAAIAAHHDAVESKSVGKHDLVIRFLRGVRRLNPPRSHLVPSWDLSSRSCRP